MLSLKLGPKTIDITSPPLKEIPERKPVCHEIMLQKIFDVFMWENSARLNDGEGGDLPRFLAGMCPDRTKE